MGSFEHGTDPAKKDGLCLPFHSPQRSSNNDPPDFRCRCRERASRAGCLPAADTAFHDAARDIVDDGGDTPRDAFVVSNDDHNDTGTELRHHVELDHDDDTGAKLRHDVELDHNDGAGSLRQ